MCVRVFERLYRKMNLFYGAFPFKKGLELLKGAQLYFAVSEKKKKSKEKKKQQQQQNKK